MEAKDNPTQEIPKSEIIDLTIQRLYEVGAIRAALELQLWEKVASGEDTVRKIVSKEGWDQAGTQVLLDAICSLQLLKKKGEHYSLVPESETYLLPGKSTYKGDMMMNEYSWEGNGKLAEAIRSGKRPMQYDATTKDVISLWIADYSRSWVYPESYLETVEKLWQSLDIQGRDGLRVLDLACGPAPRSVTLAYKHPGVQLTWLDWEGVLQTALKVATSLGVASQVSLKPGDLWSVEFGNNTFDVVYLGNVTHFFSEEEITRLFGKVYKALAPGGMIVINSVARRESEGAAWAGLWLYAATASGRAYDFVEYKTMLENAGFIKTLDINQGPIRAEKPNMET